MTPEKLVQYNSAMRAINSILPALNEFFKSNPRIIVNIKSRHKADIMHSNQTYNIIQSKVGFSAKKWAVIKGTRLPSGHPAEGSMVIQDGLTRDSAIALADRLESRIN